MQPDNPIRKHLFLPDRFAMIEESQAGLSGSWRVSSAALCLESVAGDAISAVIRVRT